MHQFDNRLLGLAGVLGAPWIFIDFIQNGLYERFDTSSESGVHNFLFLAGWLCSIMGLYRAGAMGPQKWRKGIMVMQLFFLGLAIVWSVIEIVSPHSTSKIYYYLNFFWPVAGFFMLITGIVIYSANRLAGWKRYMPLLTGLWFPFTTVVSFLNGPLLSALIISGIYATVSFMLLGLTLLINDFAPAERNIR